MPPFKKAEPVKVDEVLYTCGIDGNAVMIYKHVVVRTNPDETHIRQNGKGGWSKSVVLPTNKVRSRYASTEIDAVRKAQVAKADAISTQRKLLLRAEKDYDLISAELDKRWQAGEEYK